MAGLSVRASRSLFLIELVLFAAPSFAVLSFSAIMLGGWSLFAALAAMSAPFWQDVPVDIAGVGVLAGIAGFFAMLVFVAAAGCKALWSFLKVVDAFRTGGADALRRHARVFRRGLFFAVPAVATMSIVAFVSIGSASLLDAVVAFYLSGLALLTPILHMALEMRFRPVSCGHGR